MSRPILKKPLALLLGSLFCLSAEAYGNTVEKNEDTSRHCDPDVCALTDPQGARDNDARAELRPVDLFTFSRPPGANSERLLPDEQFVFWGLDEVKSDPDARGRKVVVEKTISETVSVASKEKIENIRFVSGKHDIDEKFVDKLREVLKRLSHLDNVRLHFIGHTDSQRLSPRARAIYGDNYGLGLSRAKRAAYFFKEKLGLPESAISFEGKGPDEPLASNDTEAGMALNRRVEIQVWYDEVRKRTVSEEKWLPAPSIHRTLVCRQRPMCQRVEKHPKYKRIVLENAVEPIRFDVAQSRIPESFIKKIRSVLDSLEGRDAVQLKFIGHTDSQRLSPRASKIYGDNLGLSVARAKQAATLFKQKLHLDDDSVKFEGKGATEPVAENTTARGRALNRRVEIEVSYRVPDGVAVNDIEGEIVQCPSGDLPDDLRPLDGQARSDNPFTMTPWHVSIDGEPVAEDHVAHGADQQRCTDVALEKASLQLQYDRLAAQPKLNLAVWPNVAVEQDTLYFRGWSNYPAWIDRAEVIIYYRGFSKQKTIVERIPLNDDMETSWVVNANGHDRLWYALRVYHDAGDPGQAASTFDETIGKPLPVFDHYPDGEPDPQQRESALRAGYGKNSLRKQAIPVNGGTITVNGLNIPQDKNVWVMGRPVPVDAQGRFVSQQIIPVGLHTAEVAVLDDGGNGELLWRDLEFRRNDWFYVGIADITLSLNDHGGRTDLISSRHLDDDFTQDGRIAFYAKGKLKAKYTLTTSLDTREAPLSELFSNFHKKDPTSLLRRLDSEDYYPTFGDDATLREDAPTQGKFYIKLEDEKSHLLWGNYKLNLSENELAVINRGLYGAHLRYQSDGQTADGERRTRIDAFAAEPGTIPSYEEFRGTGGSLYYLQHQDITRGSEQLRIEVRDKDSGVVLSSIPLVAGQDYDLDALQGTILLTQPLGSTARDTQLVRNSSLSGHPVTLVVNYEYVPGFTDPGALATGGRAEHWLNDHIQIGFTGSKQDQTGGTQKLGSLDLTLKKTDHSWLKVTAARTEGPGVTERKSLDGGFDFTTSTTTTTGNRADAGRIEGAFDLQEFGADAPVQGTFYWQKREAGFSSSGQQTAREVVETAIDLESPLGESTRLGLRYRERDEKAGQRQQAVEADVSQQLGEHWSASAGARYDSHQEAPASTAPSTGKRTDGVLQVTYDSHDDWQASGFVQGTLNRDDSRLRNNRVGVGIDWQARENLTLSGEVSDGTLGTGASAGANYQMSERTNLYLNYALDTDDPESGIGNNKSTVIAGGRSRFSDSASVYAEEKYTLGNQPRGLTQAYGVELATDEHWTYGLSMELGKLQSESNNEISRKAFGLRAGYSAQRTVYAGALEYRTDDSATEKRNSWLVRNNYQYQTNPDWRFIGRLDVAWSDSSKGTAFDGDFTEAVLGYAWRPVDNERWNGLFKYTLFYDKTSPDQLTPTEVSIDFQQRSHILAFDLNYDLTKRWTIGGKYAFKRGEIRDRLATTDWLRSDASLYILRADWHVIKKWDLLLESRLLDLPDANDHEAGALVAVYRHFGEHFKLGAGYNFTTFSDDLTDLDYDAQGIFINLIGKI